MESMLPGTSVQLATLSTAFVSVTLLPEPVASRLLTAVAWVLATDDGADGDEVTDCGAVEDGGDVADDVLDEGDVLGADADEAGDDAWDGGGREPRPDELLWWPSRTTAAVAAAATTAATATPIPTIMARDRRTGAGRVLGSQPMIPPGPPGCSGHPGWAGNPGPPAGRWAPAA
jgi:hypothetical protein